MTITSNPANTLPSVIRYEDFSVTISYSSSDANVTITSAKCVKNFVDANVYVANGTNSVTISHQHWTGFQQDEVKYVEKGSSDLLQVPTILNNIGDTPPNKDVYEVNQDPTEGIYRTYTVTVNYTGGSQQFDYSQYVRNDVTVGYNFLRNYY